MEKNEYFGLMKETSDVADEIILDKIKSRYVGPLYDLVSDLPSRKARSGKPKSRPAILRFSYELAGGENWIEYKNVAGAVEMLNLSTYVLNYFLDDKGGEKPIHQRKNECMASMILRELAQELILDSIGNIDSRTSMEIIRRFSEINHFTSGIGQWLDATSLRLEDWPLRDEYDIQSYMADYIERCEGLTGVFMKNVAAIGGLLAGASKSEITKLEEFGRNYGILVQIINDLGDFIPPKIGVQGIGKVYQDQYSDLKHGCITFPAYHVLRVGTSEQKEAIIRVKGNMEAVDCFDVTEVLIESGAVEEAKKLASSFAKTARRALDRFPKSLARDFLSTSLSISRTNKFYGAFRNIEKEM